MSEHDDDAGVRQRSAGGDVHARTDGARPQGAAARATHSPTIHDDPTIVEDDPEPVPTPTSERGHRLPGGLERLAERYQLEEPIAAGGAAMVWRAFDEVLSRTVAIKLLHAHLAGDPRTVERFRQESINAARLTHPNVVAIHDTGQEGDLVYLVMEHVDGPTLREVVAQRGALDPDEVAALGQQVAAALGEAHTQGLVHRDVKPANILLSSDGTAKVTDFGIAKALSAVESVTTSPGMLVGTAAYVAPEQLADGQRVDPRADVFSLGVVLHEALTGRRAFRGATASATAAARLNQQLEPVRRLRPDVPRALADVVERATTPDPAERFEDGAAMAEALVPLLRRRPSETTESLVASYRTREDLDERVPPVTYQRPARRRLPYVPPRLRRAVAPFVAGVLVGLTGALLLDGPPPEEPSAVAPPPEGVAPVIAVADLDPYGGDREDPRSVVALVDGDPGSTWRTEGYAGGMAQAGVAGVGVWFDLGRPTSVADVALELRSGLVAGELMVRDEPPTLGGTEEQWRRVADLGRTGPGLERVPVGTTARWWLVWLTDLEQQDGVGLAELAEVRFEVAP